MPSTTTGTALVPAALGLLALAAALAAPATALGVRKPHVWLVVADDVSQIAAPVPAPAAVAP